MKKAVETNGKSYNTTETEKQSSKCSKNVDSMFYDLCKSDSD